MDRSTMDVEDLRAADGVGAPRCEREARLGRVPGARMRERRTDRRVAVDGKGGCGRHAGCERRGVLEVSVAFGEGAGFPKGLTPSERY